MLTSIVATSCDQVETQQHPGIGSDPMPFVSIDLFCQERPARIALLISMKTARELRDALNLHVDVTADVAARLGGMQVQS